MSDDSQDDAAARCIQARELLLDVEFTHVLQADPKKSRQVLSP